MKIHAGSDHAGYKLKNALVAHLRAHGHEVSDVGTNSEESTDYPDYAAQVGRAVRDEPGTFGLLVCSSGIGVSIAANKVRGVRAAHATNAEMSRLSRAHNDANVLCLGQKFTPEDEARNMIDTFLSTQHDGGRHTRRIGKIADLERNER